MVGGVDRALGLASIGVGFVATVVVAVAVSADYWLYTDEPMDPGLPPTAPGDDGDATAAAPGDRDQDAGTQDEAESTSSVVMVATHSGLWRFCIDDKVDFTGENRSPIQQNVVRFCPVLDSLGGGRTGRPL